eukprot:scaffold24086_cov26-Tisochrysis_lutea.AAC.1
MKSLPLARYGNLRKREAALATCYPSLTYQHHHSPSPNPLIVAQTRSLKDYRLPCCLQEGEL